MTASAAARPETVAPIVLEIESAERRHRTAFTLRFALTWFVVLAAVSIFLATTVKINWGFLAEWLPFILGGVWVTLFISAVSIIFAVILAVFGALGRLSTNPY